MRSTFYLLFLLVLLLACEPINNKGVRVVGALQNVMHKGQLEGNISLDSLSENGYYGIGPLAGLRGEILLFDGVPYVSFIKTNAVAVEEMPSATAPFLVYAQVKEWEESALPAEIQTQKQLENYLTDISGESAEPFPFILSGMVAEADYHIQNLPEGTQVSSPAEAHQGQQNFTLQNTEVDMLGFYSKKHKGIFTHKDSYMHMHILSSDKSQMGHLDAIEFGNNSFRLLLPKN